MGKFDSSFMVPTCPAIINKQGEEDKYAEGQLKHRCVS